MPLQDINLDDRTFNDLFNRGATANSRLHA